MPKKNPPKPPQLPPEPEKYDPVDELSAREVAFAEAFVRLNVGTKAAVAAGYSKKGDSVTAARLLHRPRVQAEIARLRNDIQQKRKLEADFVINGLMREAEVGENSAARIRAHELLGKTLHMFVDRVEVTEKLSPEERRQRLAALGAKARERFEKQQGGDPT